MKDERKMIEGTLIVNNQTIELQEKGGGKPKKIFSLKYTINHPRVDISSNDTKMINIYFAELENEFFDSAHSESMDLKEHSYDLEAMSR